MNYLINRYKKNWLRASAHALCTGVVTAFLVHLWGQWGFVGLITPFIIEAIQYQKDSPHDYLDIALDILEHLAGGLVIGSLFLL